MSGLFFATTERVDPIDAFIIARRLESVPSLAGFRGVYRYDLRHGYSRVSLDELDTKLSSFLAEKGKDTIVIAVDRSDGYIQKVGCTNFNGSLVLWQYSTLSGNVLVLSLFSDDEDVYELGKTLKSFLDGAFSVLDDEDIKVKVYWHSTIGPSFASVITKAPRWSSISGNYVSSTQQSIDSLLSMLAGQDIRGLVILHGPPGTGKTWAIRSFIRELKDRYVPCFISDADVFLERPSYYYSIADEREKNFLFILEDSADALISESRERYGQRISRILNLTDGLPSQGRDDLFLITFNEDLRHLDQAIIRPGRCLGVINFERFSRDEAYDWLLSREWKEDRDLDQSTYSLAELYAILNGRDHERTYLVPNQPSVGFLAQVR